MTRSRKTNSDATHLGKRLKICRLERNFTLTSLAELTGIDVSQLSRFERGEFVFVSRNLQNLMSFLQIDTEIGGGNAQQLVGRFEALVTRSSRHEEAARALVCALEALR